MTPNSFGSSLNTSASEVELIENGPHSFPSGSFSTTLVLISVSNDSWKRPANDWLKTVLDVTPLSVLFCLKNVVYDVAALYIVKYLIKEVGINTAISTLDKEGFENSMCIHLQCLCTYVYQTHATITVVHV